MYAFLGARNARDYVLRERVFAHGRSPLQAMLDMAHNCSRQTLLRARLANKRSAGKIANACDLHVGRFLEMVNAIQTYLGSGAVSLEDGRRALEECRAMLPHLCKPLLTRRHESYRITLMLPRLLMDHRRFKGWHHFYRDSQGCFCNEVHIAPVR